MRTVLSLAIVVWGVSVSAQTTDLVELIGKTRSDITSVFPGSGTTLRQWNGWKEAILFFNTRRELVTVSLLPATPMTEQQADDAIRRLGVNVAGGNYFAAATERGYSEIAGPIRTVSYRVDGERVIAIGIFSRLADID